MGATDATCVSRFVFVFVGRWEDAVAAPAAGALGGHASEPPAIMESLEHAHRSVAASQLADVPFDRVGGSQVDPVLGREVIKSEQVVLVFFEALTRTGKPRAVEAKELVVGLLSVGTQNHHPKGT